MIPFEAFCGDEYLGSGWCDHGQSFHYFCPLCGTVWARTICPTHSHVAIHVRCPDHPHPFWPPATMYQEFPHYRIEWPRAVLVRDFLYLCDLNISAPVIDNNLPSDARHDQHQAT